MNRKSSLVRVFISLSTFIASLAILVGLWQLASTYWIRPVWISSPSLIGSRISLWTSNGSLVHNTWVTTEEALVGLIAGVILGTIAGIVLAVMPSLLSRTLEPYVVAAYTLPRVALAPFFVIWFGIGLESKALLVTSIVFFIVLFNVRQGMGSIDHELLDGLRSMHASKYTMLRRAILPALLPWIVSSIKIGVGTAMIGAVVGELFGATAGLGWEVTQSLAIFDMTGAILAMLSMTVVAALMFYVVVVFERYAFRWNTHSLGTSTTVN